MGSFLAEPDCEVTHLCDVRDAVLAKRGEEVRAKTGKMPKLVRDYRELLSDPSIDAFMVATPDHWHALLTIWGCQAGKDVYVEKPMSHNVAEGKMAVEAARKYNRIVQHGTQGRSLKSWAQALDLIESGKYGKVLVSRALCYKPRGSIGIKPITPAPKEIDFDIWTGPAPKQPHHANLVHYNWHWFWDFGNGELGNNGIHMLDLARWGLQTTSPIRVVSSGGRYAFQDDQQTPDTQIVSFEFADGKQILYEGLSCSPHSESAFVSFHGTDGSMDLDEGGSYRIYNRRNQKIEEAKATGQGMQEHLVNFLDAVRSSDPKRLNQPILEGHLSTLLCHLGNIAQRTGRILRFDPQSQQILEDPKQQSLWERPYADGWRDRLAT